MKQRRARLILAMLEPQAPDSLARWGFCNTVLEGRGGAGESAGQAHVVVSAIQLQRRRYRQVPGGAGLGEGAVGERDQNLQTTWHELSCSYCGSALISVLKKLEESMSATNRPTRDRDRSNSECSAGKVGAGRQPIMATIARSYL
jgi:hypothetical protein